MKFLLSGRVWFGIGISVLCLWLALKDVPFSELGGFLKEANYWWILPAMFVQLLSIIARGQRWAVLLQVRGHLADTFWAHNIGYLMTNVLPLRMGEPARVLVIADRCKLPFMHVGATAAVERLLDVATVVVALLCVLPWMRVPDFVLKAALTLSGVVLAAFVTAILAVRFREFTERLLVAILRRLRFLPQQLLLSLWGELLDGLAPVLHWRTALSVAFWSVMSWILTIGYFWCVLLAFRTDGQLIEAAFVVVALAFALTVPSSPGFIGVFQYVGQQALVLPFEGKYHDTDALAITLTMHLTYYLFTCLLGMFALWRFSLSMGQIIAVLQRRKGDPHAAPPDPISTAGSEAPLR